MEFLFSVLTLIAIVAVFSIVVKSPRESKDYISDSGRPRNYQRLDRAEWLVADQLDRLDPEFYTVFNNVMIPSRGNTSLTQIDHVVVSRFGIFCIETKSHKGWIFGSSDQKYWMQVLYREKYRIYNPTWQNFAHTKALELLLGQNLKSRIISLIAFPNAGKVKIDNKDMACGTWNIVEKIAQYKVRVYDPYEYERIVQSIQAANITDQAMVEKHNDEVRSVIDSVHA